MKMIWPQAKQGPHIKTKSWLLLIARSVSDIIIVPVSTKLSGQKLLRGILAGSTVSQSSQDCNQIGCLRVGWLLIVWQGVVYK